MRNRRMVLAIFLLVAVFCIGSGFANVIDALDIIGTADITKEQAQAAFNEDVYFLNATAQAPNTAHVDANNNDRATFTINSLKGAGDTATFTFTVVNTGDLAATVTVNEVTNNNGEYFAFSYSIANDGNLPAKSGETDGELTITVTVTLQKTPTADLTSVTYNLELYATAQSAPVSP